MIGSPVKPSQLVVVLLALGAGCGGKKEGSRGGEDWRWKVAPTELAIPWGSKSITIKARLPTGWDKRDSIRGVRLAMPEQEGMINGSIDLGPSMNSKKAKESAAEPVDPSYKLVDPPREIAPGRWSRVFLEPGAMSKDRVRYDAAVYWDVGPVTLGCLTRVVGPTDDPAVWGQALDACTSVEATVPKLD